MALDRSKIVAFEWNQGNLKHIQRHRVNYKECEQVFFNKPLLIYEDKAHSEAEKRFNILGLTNRHRLIFLTFTVRNKKIRVISARDQNKKERGKLQKVGGEKL